jgi:hypothetical protein
MTCAECNPVRRTINHWMRAKQYYTNDKIAA